jgi:very-short-patch-repair endonuclease
MANERARRLRRNPTEAETRLWSVLRKRGLAGARFRRQVPLGRYIVDFLCLDARLVVEIDGGQHATEAERDAERTRWLESQGFRVLRFWNNEVLENLDGVADGIAAALRATPLPAPPPRGGRA